MKRFIKQALRSNIRDGLNGIAQPAGVLWTPNYNAINSYISLPQWVVAGSFRMTVTAPKLPTGSANDRYIIGNPSFSNRRYIRTDSGGINLGLGDRANINTGILPVAGLPIVATVHPSTNTWECEHNGQASSGSYSGTPIHQLWLGRGENGYGDPQITDVILEDLSDSSNNRYYPCTLRSLEMPTTTVAANVLDPSGATDGVMINFGDEQPWVELKQ